MTAYVNDKICITLNNKHSNCYLMDRSLQLLLVMSKWIGKKLDIAVNLSICAIIIKLFETKNLIHLIQSFFQ